MEEDLRHKCLEECNRIFCIVKRIDVEDIVKGLKPLQIYEKAEEVDLKGNDSLATSLDEKFINSIPEEEIGNYKQPTFNTYINLNGRYMRLVP